jgi:uncharacterized protein (DUF433 family)
LALRSPLGSGTRRSVSHADGASHQDEPFLVRPYNVSTIVVQKRGSKFVEMRAGASGIPMPRIKGSRIRVSILAGHYMDVTADGMTHEQAVEDMARAYPTLTVDEIRGGIEYWRAHRKQIELEIQHDELTSSAMEIQQESVLRHFGLK